MCCWGNTSDVFPGQAQNFTNVAFHSTVAAALQRQLFCRNSTYNLTILPIPSIRSYNTGRW